MYLIKVHVLIFDYVTVTSTLQITDVFGYIYYLSFSILQNFIRHNNVNELLVLIYFC